MKSTKERCKRCICKWYCCCNEWMLPFYCEGYDGEYWGIYKCLCYHNLHIAKYLQKTHLKMKRRFPEKQVIRERIKWKTNISLVLCRNYSTERPIWPTWTLRKRIFCSCYEVLYDFARMDYLSSLINGRSETCFSPKIFQSVQTLTKADGIGRENISPKQDFQWRAHCIVNEFVGLSEVLCANKQQITRSLVNLNVSTSPKVHGYWRHMR